MKKIKLTPVDAACDPEYFVRAVNKWNQERAYQAQQEVAQKVPSSQEAPSRRGPFSTYLAALMVLAVVVVLASCFAISLPSWGG